MNKMKTFYTLESSAGVVLWVSDDLKSLIRDYIEQTGTDLNEIIEEGWGKNLHILMLEGDPESYPEGDDFRVLRQDVIAFWDEAIEAAKA